ncbi:MAG: phosphotransferase family protein [Deltaproteobacteria bacterium]|nr:phosphotransferase family protein [Deltaproteobacteria bacterium]
MSRSEQNQPRSRYYDVLLVNLDRELQPELTSERARFLYGAVRRILASLAVANDSVPPVPENLAALYPDAPCRAGRLEGSDLEGAVGLEGELLDAIEEKIRQRLLPKEQAGGGAEGAAAVTPEAIESYLRRRVDPGAKVERFKILAGGRSKQNIMLTVVDGAGAKVERVIRRDLMVGITGSTVGEEFGVLTALAARGCPVPRPLLCEGDTTVLGSAFMLMEKVEGALAGDVFDPPPAREQVLASATELARLHQLPVNEVAETLREDRRIAPSAERLRAEIAEHEDGWRAQSRAHSATMDAAFCWLCDNVEKLHPVTAIVHGDYSYHNILYSGGALSAVMDWELVRVGHPAEDLGYIRTAASKRVDWAEFIAFYYEAGGPRVSEREAIFFTLLGRLRLMAMLFKARRYFEAGMTDDLQIADVSLYHISRIIHQMSVAMREAYALPA